MAWDRNGHRGRRGDRRKVVKAVRPYFGRVILLAAGFLLLGFSGVGLASEGKVIQPIKTAGLGTLNGAEICPTGEIFLTASGNGLQLWTLQGALISTPISGTPVYAEWSQEGKIAANLGNGSYQILSRQGETLARRNIMASGIPRWVGEDAVVLIIGDKLRVLSLNNGSLLGEIDPPSNILGSAWSKRYLAITYGEGNQIYTYHVCNWSVAARIPATGPALSMGWNPEGKKLAYYLYREGIIHIWDAQTGESISERRMIGSLGRMSWSPDGSRLAVAAWDWIRIYNGTNLDPLISLEPPSSDTLTVSWTPDGNQLLTGSMDGTVALWDVSKTQTLTSQEVDGDVTRTRISPTGLMALGLTNGEVRCYSSIEMDKMAFTFTLPGGSISALDWSSDSALVAAGSDAGLVGTYTKEGYIEGRWTAHTGAVRDLQWHPDGVDLASVGDDGFLSFWDRTGNQIMRLEAESERSKHPLSLAWSPNGTMIAVGYEEGSVRIWSYPELELQTSPSRRGPFKSLEWAPHEAHLGMDVLAGAGAEDGLVLVWDVWGTAGHYQELGEHDEEVTDLSWSPDGSILATCSRDGEVRLWHMVMKDRYGTKSVGGVVELLPIGVELASVDFTPEGFVMAASTNGVIYRWLPTDRLLWSIRNHTLRIRDLSWSPDSKKIAYNSGSRELGIYDPASETIAKWDLQMTKEISSILCLDWSPNGVWIAVGEYPTKIRVLDHAFQQVFECEHPGGAFCLEWSPDSSYLASGGADRVIRIWDGGTGNLMTTLSGHNDIIISLSWSKDGRWLVSGSHDGSVKIWDMDTGMMADTRRLGDRVLGATLNPETSSIAAVAYDYQAGINLFVLDDKGGAIWTQPLRGASSDLVWSPDGEYLVVPSTSAKMVFNRWGYAICNLSWPTWDDRLEWSPDGKYIASGGYDGVLKLYDAEPIRQIPDGIGTTTIILLAVIPLSAERSWRK